MSPGAKVHGTRPRAESNQRLDLVEFDALALTTKLGIEAAIRALLASPKATAGVPTGERWTGSITANPTGAADGLVRLDTDVFVGLDANGAMVLKPSGTTVSIAIPAGGSDYQVYAYTKDLAEDTQVRRKLPATAPFTEFAVALATALRQTTDLYARLGGSGSVVAEDSVSGVTRSLLFLGIANNTAGNVTFTPAANMLETVTVPATGPTTSAGTTSGETTVTGGASTLRELLNAALYSIGQIAWKGSDTLTPSAANNYGAYQIPAGGVDKAFKQGLQYITIGNGTTIVGDFNTSDYASSKLLLEAAMAALPATGGTIFIKNGVTLSDFDGAQLVITKKVTLQGWFVNGGSIGTPIITFTTGESISSTAQPLTLKDLTIQHSNNALVLSGSSTYQVINCIFDKPDSAEDDAAILGNTDISGLLVEDTTFYSAMSVGNGTVNAMALSIPGVGSHITMRRVKHYILGDECGSVKVVDLRNNFMIDDYECLSGGSASNLVQPYLLNFDTTTNTNQLNRVVRNFRAVGSTTSTAYTFMHCITSGSVGNIIFEDLWCKNFQQVFETFTAPSSGKITFRDCYFESGQECNFLHFDSSTAFDGVIVDNCKFIHTGVGSCGDAVHLESNVSINELRVIDCTFSGFREAIQSMVIISVAVGGGTSGILKEVTIERNQFIDFQNIAYSGGTGHSAMIEVWVAKCESVIVRDNTAYNIMNGTSGSTRDQAYLLRTFNGVNLGYFQSIIVEGNKVGSLLDVCGLWNHYDQLILNARVTDNIVRITWDTTSGAATWLAGSVVRINSTTAAFGAHRQISFDNNTVEVANNNDTDYSLDLYYHSCDAAATNRNVSIQGNNFYSNSASKKFDYSNAYGINLTACNIYNAMVAGNNAASATLADAWRIRAQGTITNATNDLTPGTGTLLTGNNGLYGQG
jgi:hypothetical protein